MPPVAICASATDLWQLASNFSLKHGHGFGQPALRRSVFARNARTARSAAPAASGSYLGEGNAVRASPGIWRAYMQADDAGFRTQKSGGHIPACRI